MFNLTSPSEASRRATKKASRVISSLKNTLRSTLSRTPKQHLKEQKPQYRLCSNPSITVTDTETGEEWDFIDHDELDCDLANSHDTRTLREELEINAREQEDFLYSRRWIKSATINTNFTPTFGHLTLNPFAISRNLRVPASTYTSELSRSTPQPSTTSPGLSGYDNTTIANTGMSIPSDPSLESPAECTKPSMFSMLVKKVITFIKGPSDEDKERNQKENTANNPEDDTEPWEVIPTIKDDPWTVVVKSRNAIAEFDDSGAKRQTQYERTYQYEFDRRVVEANRLAIREVKMRASK
ncbi:hypothetical protein F52700_12496 [Fusarium sp. NRRL 52700]|nr:hypothetical protein F52700_12496 [Fusarium sp. NRRL 52700]